MCATILACAIMLPLQLWFDLTGSIDVYVWPPDRNEAINRGSLFLGKFCCNVNIHGRKHYTLLAKKKSALNDENLG